MNESLTYRPFAIAFGQKEYKVDEKKIKEQREKLCGICKVCGEPLQYVGGNVLACKNEKCRGYKHTRTNEAGEEITYYTPVFRLLDEKGSAIAQRLFND